MSDPTQLPILQQNVRKMMGAGAPTEDIDGYLKSKGWTPEDFKAANVSAQQPQAPSFDESPLPMPQMSVSRFRGPSYMVPDTGMAGKAARAGVLYDKPASAGQFGLSFAYDINSPSAQKYLSNELTLAANKGAPPFERQHVQVRIGPKTGELEYFDPETKRFALVNQPGFDVGDVKRNAATVGQIGLEGLASSLGSLAGPAGTYGAGAGTAAASEAIRLIIGRNMGVNEGMSDEDIAKQAAIAAGLSVAGGAAAAGVLKIVKTAANFLKGRVFTSASQAAFAPGMQQAKALEHQITGRYGTAATGPSATNLKFNLAQATGDPNLLNVAEMNLRTPGSRQLEMLAQRKGQQQALAGYKQAIDQPQGIPTSRYEAGQQIQNELVLPQQQTQARYGAQTQQADIAAQSAANTLPAGSPTVAGSRVTNTLLGEKDSFKGWASQEAAKVDTAAGNIPIANTNLSETAKTFSQETKDAIFGGLQADKKNVVGAATEAVPQPSPNVVFLRESLGAPAIPKSKPSAIFDPNTKWTFQQAWDAVSTLKRLARKAKSDPSTLGPDAATYTRLAGALEADINESLAGTPGATAYDAFKAQYKSQKGLLDSTLHDAVVARPSEVFKQVFESGDRELADQTAYLVDKSPEAKAAFRDAIFNDYRQKVFVQGRVDPARHAQWMQQYGDLAKPYFSPTDFKLLSNANTAELGFQKAAVEQGAVEAKIKGSFGGKLTSMEPQAVFKQLWAEGSDGELAQFLTIAPDTSKEALRGAVIKDMGPKISNYDPVTRQPGAISFPKLDKYIQENDTKMKLLFGPGYLKDMGVLRDAVEMAQRKPITVGPSGTAVIAGQGRGTMLDTLLTLSRAAAGPLSHGPFAGRQILKLRQQQVERVVHEAIMDPDLLHQLVSLRTVEPGTAQAARILGNLGGLELFQQQ